MTSAHLRVFFSAHTMMDSGIWHLDSRRSKAPGNGMRMRIDICAVFAMIKTDRSRELGNKKTKTHPFIINDAIHDYKRKSTHDPILLCQCWMNLITV